MALGVMVGGLVGQGVGVAVHSGGSVGACNGVSGPTPVESAVGAGGVGVAAVPHNEYAPNPKRTVKIAAQIKTMAGMSQLEKMRGLGVARGSGELGAGKDGAATSATGSMTGWVDASV